MEFEFWWLLAIPLFFALGWMAARIDIKQVVTESRSVPDSYFRGLNFLLNEQPDKALDAFLEVVKLDPETVELHFTLGALFRKRGEIDRAIRMHENLLERETLASEDRLKALTELGQDYLKAGLLDRAEEVFTRLLETPYAGHARRYLLEIFVQEKDWHKAIQAANELEQHSARPMNAEIAHFHCELALLDSVKGEAVSAKAHLQSALESYRQCVRANIMLGDLAAASGEYEAALATWKLIEAQNPTHMVLIIDRMLESYRQLDQLDSGLVWLKALLTRHPSLDLFNSLHHVVMETQGGEAAYQLARDELRRQPSLHALEKLAEAELLTAPEDKREVVQNTKSLIQRHAQRLTRYHCASCGFKASQFFWRCPACGRWDGFDPARHEE